MFHVKPPIAALLFCQLLCQCRQIVFIVEFQIQCALVFAGGHCDTPVPRRLSRLISISL